MLENIVKKDWINDHYRTPKWWVGLILFLFIPVIKALVDNLSVDAAAWRRPDLAEGSPEFLAYLKTNPVESTAVMMLSIGLLYLICWFCGAKFFGPRKTDTPLLRWVFIGLALTAVVQVLSVAPDWLGFDLGTVANQAQINEHLKVSTWPMIICNFVLFPAFTEELVYRGLLQRYWLPQWPVVGMLLSGVFFAGIHFTTNWYHTLLFFLSGLSFAYVYNRTGRLEVTIAMHAIGNFLILLWVVNSF